MDVRGESANSVIENPVSGETIIIRTGADETDGRVLAWELRLAPGGKVPSGHTHPQQEERFTVREGRMRFRVGGRSRVCGPGETVVVPPGTAHHFSNAGRVEARVDVETSPALQMEELLRTAAALSRGRGDRPRRLPRPADLLLFMRDFRSEVAAPYLPVRLMGRAVGVLAKAVERVRLDRRYRQLRQR